MKKRVRERPNATFLTYRKRDRWREIDNSMRARNAQIIRENYAYELLSK